MFLMGNPMTEENYGVTWDQTMLLTTPTHPALTQPQSLVYLIYLPRRDVRLSRPSYLIAPRPGI